MSGGGNKAIRVDRRTTIKWLAATMAAAHAACSNDEKFLGEEIPPAPGALPGMAGKPGDVGYGKDPDLINPGIPWPRTMTEAQLRTAGALCDAIIPADERSPAASAVGVPDFIDEWISAPYPQHRRDRELILAGLAWLERQSRERNDRDFASADDRRKEELLERIADASGAASALGDHAAFFDRFRYLTVGAFYTTEAGIGDIGYIGNMAASGNYPGPSDEAMAHLSGVLEQLGLRLPA